MLFLKSLIKQFKDWSLVKRVAVLMLLAGLIIGLWVLIGGGYIFGIPLPDENKAQKIQPFITALVTPLLTLGSTLLIFENLRTTSQQNFSNNFFKLIDQHHKLVDNINTWIDGISSEEKPCKGRTFFDELAERIACDYYHLPTKETTVKNNLANNLSTSNEEYCPYPFKPANEIDVAQKIEKEKLIYIYDHYYHIRQSELSHYFRNLYHIVRYAERAQFSFEIQIEHVKILRAQLSNYELLLLAYNGMHEYGKEFHKLIEKYELLKNLNSEERLTATRNKRIIDLNVLKEAYPHLQKYL